MREASHDINVSIAVDVAELSFIVAEIGFSNQITTESLLYDRNVRSNRPDRVAIGPIKAKDSTSIRRFSPQPDQQTRFVPR